MVIVVFATDDEQWHALTANNVGVNWIKGSNDFNCTHYPNADAFFLLNNIDAFNFLQTKKTVFINSVVDTLASLNTPPKCSTYKWLAWLFEKKCLGNSWYC